MRCYVILLLILLIILPLTAGEIDDFRFAVGLYRDSNYNLAKVEMERFLGSYPESTFLSNISFLLANIYLIEENYTDAEKLFKNLEQVGAEPVIRPDIYLGLAQTYFFTENYSQAKNYLKRFQNNFPNHRLLWKAEFFLGRIAYLEGRYTESLQFLTSAEVASQDWDVRLAKLQTLIALDNRNDAEKMLNVHIENQLANEHLNRMIVLYLNHLLSVKEYEQIRGYAYDFIPFSSQYYDDYLLIIGEAKYEMGDYQLALARFDALSRRTERASYLIALCYMNLGNETEAERMFTDLSSSARNLEIRTNSHFFLATLKARTDIRAANRMLEDFISRNPEHQFLGAAYYQLGFNYFRQDIFDEAIVNLQRALSLTLSAEFREKGQFLIAESYFQIKHYQEAKSRYEEYLQQFSTGQFVDEVLFKLALYHYERDDKPNALVKIDRIINEFPDSQRLSMAYFYKAEIFSATNQTEIALQQYQRSLEDFADKGLVWLRIAQINFRQGAYNQALADLHNVPATESYLFEREIIKGNIHYAKREYLEALRAFEAAARNHRIDSEWEDATVRQARTLYQLQEYRETTNLYQQLFDRFHNKQYLLMAATASFTAEDYRRAISFYNRYRENYPDEDDIFKVKLHTADSHYNLREYETAAKIYSELIRPDIDRYILDNSLNGLEWSSLQSETLDFAELVNRVIEADSPNEFKVMLYKRKIDYYYGQQLWNDIVNTTRYLIQIAPVTDDLRHYRTLMGVAMTNLKLFSEGERVFRELHNEKQEAIVLEAWSRLHLAREDSLSALQRLQQAANLSNQSQLWLDMLTLSVSIDSDSFNNYYERYLQFARNADRERGKLLWIRWNLRKNNYDVVEPVITELLNSSFEPIKARAQYYKGVRLYRMGNASAAIPELLRVRYLYPRVEDVRLDAEILAIEAYIATNDRDNARRLYDSIRNDLSPAQRSNLATKLGLEG